MDNLLEPEGVFCKLSSLKKLLIPSYAEVVDDVPQQHPYLEELAIDYCKGTKLPNCILSLYCLTKLTVCGAERVLSLPALGMLPSLQELDLRNFLALEFIGREFLGIGNNKHKYCFAAFPKLVKLELWNLDKLEVWEDINPEDEYITVMPKLQVLRIKFCRQLQVFPRRLFCKASSLEKLNFYKNSDSLTETIKNDGELLLHIKEVYVNGLQLQANFC